MKKIFIIMVLIGIAVPLFSAGQQAIEETTEPVEITALIANDNTPPEDNPVLQEIRKRTGIYFNPTVVNGTQIENKLNAMIASNTLPDIFHFDKIMGKKLVDNDVILPVEDLLNDYGESILENKGDILHSTINSGNHIYDIPNPAEIYPRMTAVRTDWLDNLGMDVPKTVDDFYDVLKAFTYDDPDGNGEDDTIGYGCFVTHLFNMTSMFAPFGVSVGNHDHFGYHYIDGKVVPFIMHPNFLDAIKFARKCYQEGLIEPDFATIPAMPMFEKLWNGRYGAFTWGPVATTNNWLGRYTEDPIQEFEYVIIRGKNGEGGVICPYLEDADMVGISASSEHPEEAMQLLNFINSEEGNELVYFGIEGKHYKWNEDGTVTYIPPYDDKNVHRNDGGYVYRSVIDRIHGAEFKTLNTITREAILMGQQNRIDETHIFQTPEIELEMGNLMLDMMKEMVATLMVTKGDVEKEYNEYIDKFLKSGGDKWIEQATNIYELENF